MEKKTIIDENIALKKENLRLKKNFQDAGKSQTKGRKEQLG